jgi:D-alanine--D-alanine ligase
MDLAFKYDPECLVERFIPGREMTVAVVDGRPLPAIEIVPATAFYNYDSKYADDRTEYHYLDDTTSKMLGQLAVRACKICDVRGIARVDLRTDLNDKPWLLEVNTIPGMTSHSLVPKAAARAGLSLGQLCEHVIRTRLEG